MKSCLGLLLSLLVAVSVLGTGGLIWYLNRHTEFSRKDTLPRVVTPPPVR